MIRISQYIVLCFGLVMTQSHLIAGVWNNPNLGKNATNTRYMAMTEPPKTLDPARSYSTEEHQITAQIYEPVLQYHYLRRPYQLVPLTAVAMPRVTYFDQHDHEIKKAVPKTKIAYSVYDITIQPHIYYQPHPALATDEKGEYRYLKMTRKALKPIHSLKDFQYSGTRELLADDYVYEIKRLASPKTQSPIFGVMDKYIIGFKEFSQQLQAVNHSNSHQAFIDLRQYDLLGVKLLDHYHYQIKIKGKYPQFEYWLAMIFFAPIPWEADAFYSQLGLIEKNITLDTYPIGTGPYFVAINNPNKAIVLLKNPNFHHETYPSDGEATDASNGYLEDANQQLPFIDKIVYALDKESIPRWNKFLQGYYDKSGITAEGFDYAVKVDASGEPYLTPKMVAQGVKLQTTVIPGIYYLGFNMLDPVVGGYSEEKRKLRQAIAIVLDDEEFITIFNNGRGIPAQGPIPPGIFGYEAGAKGINPYVYIWKNGKLKRQSLAVARQLMREAGYPNGIDPKTKKPLILNYDATTTGSPDDKAHFDWYRKQFAKIGIQLNIRATLYSRFRDKVQTGHAQLFSWGWIADYPDPENFLFLFYTPNSKAKYGGENATNYSNPVADRLFEEIRMLPNGELRQQKINEWLEVVRRDSPWVFGFYPIEFVLGHQWNRVSKPLPIGYNTMKYERFDQQKRQTLQTQWNQPIIWPLIIMILLLILIFLPLTISYWRREHKPVISKISLGKKKS